MIAALPRFIAICAVVLPLAQPEFAWASEREEFPTEEHRLPFYAYMNGSDRTLRNFDNWTKSKVNQGGRNWANECNEIKQLLEVSYDRAKAEFGELPDEVVDWYREEAKAWDNVLNIGSDLIRLHDRILDTKRDIEERHKQVKRMASSVAAIAPNLQQALEFILDIPSIPKGGFPELEAMVEKAVGRSAGKLTVLLTTLREETQATLRIIEQDNYPSRLRALQNKKIDPDQDGVFAEHERTWEENLRKVLEEFEQVSADYADAAELVYEGETLESYPLLRPAGSQVTDHVRGLIDGLKRRLTRAARDMGPPKADILPVRIRDFREPGDSRNIRVMVRNTGKTPLKKNEWALRCSIVSHPEHYRPGSKDFDCGDLELDGDLDPGRAHAFAYPVEAPEATGDWTLQWDLERNGKTMSRETTSFKILGEVGAKFVLIKINGRNVVNKRVIKPTGTVKVDLTIENVGTEILFKNRCRMVAKVKRKIKGKNQWKSFRINLPPPKDIVPGKRVKISDKLEAPGTEGTWEVQFEFLANRRRILEETKVVVARHG